MDGVQVELCGMMCVNLNNETLKILGVHFCIIKISNKIKNFRENIAKIENIFKLWRMRQFR